MHYEVVKDPWNNYELCKVLEKDHHIVVVKLRKEEVEALCNFREKERRKESCYQLTLW